mmetsp:Transcript_72045/g.220530  ORF Transcript_72045/g.220530 Transcript_72045/m.220530 type:complete len:207 (-) Transcript_72045:793-1413(-)
MPRPLSPDLTAGAVWLLVVLVPLIALEALRFDSARFSFGFPAGGSPSLEPSKLPRRSPTRGCSCNITTTTVMSSALPFSNASSHMSDARRASVKAVWLAFASSACFKTSTAFCAVKCSHTPSLQRTRSLSLLPTLTCSVSGSWVRPMPAPQRSPMVRDMFSIGPYPPFLWTLCERPSNVTAPLAFAIRLASEDTLGLWSGVKYLAL